MISPAIVPELICADIATSLAFYEGIGFRVLFSRPEERFAYLSREGANLMLEQSTGRQFLIGALEHPFGRGMNLQIRTTDVRSLFAIVKMTSAPIMLELEEKWYARDGDELGNLQFVVADPDGYLLRFYEDLGSRPTRNL